MRYVKIWPGSVKSTETETWESSLSSCISGFLISSRTPIDGRILNDDTEGDFLLFIELFLLWFVPLFVLNVFLRCFSMVSFFTVNEAT